MNYTSRSEILAYQACPRKRYWGSLYKGGGLQPKALRAELVAGLACHEGVGALLQGSTVDRAVGHAYGDWKMRTEGRQLIGIPEDKREFAERENLALIEALVRVFAIVRLPQLLEEFDILGIEEERERSLAPGLTFQGRCDGELKDRETRRVGPYSLKTTSMWGKWQDQQARVDMQGKSESWLLEGVYDEPAGFVKMDHLVKGKYESYGQMFGGCKFYSNFLLHPYKKDGMVFASEPYSPYYEFENGSGGKTRLPKGWKKTCIWQDGEIGVKEWIERLVRKQFFNSELVGISGEEILAEFVRSPIAYRRTPKEIETWRRQVQEQEQRVFADAEFVEAVRALGTSEGFEKILDARFRQHFDRCFDYNSICEFWQICMENVNPDDSAFYESRERNHPIPEGIWEV